MDHAYCFNTLFYCFIFCKIKKAAQTVQLFKSLGFFVKDYVKVRLLQVFAVREPSWYPQLTLS